MLWCAVVCCGVLLLCCCCCCAVLCCAVLWRCVAVWRGMHRETEKSHSAVASCKLYWLMAATATCGVVCMTRGAWCVVRVVWCMILRGTTAASTV